MARNVLVIGSGGREHALAWKLSQSRGIGTLYVAPGNGGTAGFAENVDIAATDTERLLQFALDHDIYLVVVGPDDPLTQGIVDIFEDRGIRTFGPTQDAAALEASKVFAKHLMRHYGVPTAAFETFDSHDEALSYLLMQGAPIVVKADGLALGKGVYVCQTMEEAEEALRLLMVERVHGPAGDRVVIEQLVPGTEFSVHALADGISHVLFPPSQDHKRIGVGDTGPNTGGMGVVAPLPWVTADMMAKVDRTVVTPALAGIQNDGTPFTGCLYPGLMADGNVVNTLEFNVRFGDPETQVYMALLQNDLLGLLLACVNGTLGNFQLKWRPGFAACVVLVSEGYPGAYQKGVPITLPASLPANTHLFHAGTALADNGALVTNGGRVLNAVGLGDTLPAAIAAAYALADAVQFDGKYYRTDIGAHTLARM